MGLRFTCPFQALILGGKTDVGIQVCAALGQRLIVIIVINREVVWLVVFESFE